MIAGSDIRPSVVAHREGKLRALRPIALVGLAAGAFALGGGWTWLHPAETGYDLGDIPLGQAFISAGAVLILLRFNPTLGWVDRVPGLGRLLSVVNARAITIYLTHNIAIAVADPVDKAIGVDSTPGYAGTVAALIALAVLAFGWVEDVAARRPVKLIPGGRRGPVADTTSERRREPIDRAQKTAPIPLQIPPRMPAPRMAAMAQVPAPRRTIGHEAMPARPLPGRRPPHGGWT